jgi:hypothetical protein
MRRSTSSEDGGLPQVPIHVFRSPIIGRATARYALLGTAFLTSPLLLPFALTLLMAALHGTALGAALLQHLHLVYIGSVVYCLAALAAACVFSSPPSFEPRVGVPFPSPAQVPDPRHLEFQRWLAANGRRMEDLPPAVGGASSDSRPVDLAT